MSNINRSRTEMINGNKQQESEELLIPIKFFTKEEIKNEEDYYQYEKLKHNLKKKITEKIIDNIAKVVQENENKKDIHVFASLKTKSDSKGLYQRIKKINKRIKEPHELKACFINWIYKTPNLVDKRKRNKISKNDRNTKINNYSTDNNNYINRNNIGRYIIKSNTNNYDNNSTYQRSNITPNKKEKLTNLVVQLLI